MAEPLIEGFTLHKLLLERGSRENLLSEARYLREVASGHQTKADRYEQMAQQCCQRAAEIGGCPP